MRDMRSRILSDEEGMTLIEVVVASVILFVILTGVLGLVLQTTRMSTQAKQQNVLTNAISDYTEWLNTLTFEEVDIVGTDDGILEERTETVGPYTLVFRPTVTPAAGSSALKTVRVDVDITRTDGWTQQISTSVIIRDRTQFLTQASVNPDDRPTVSFLPSTAPDGATVWGDNWTGGKLEIAVEAHAVDGREISTVKFFMQEGNRPLHNTAGVPGQWAGYGQSFSSSAAQTDPPKPFYWDTLYVELDHEGNPAYQPVKDGLVTIGVEVIDDRGVSAVPIYRQYLVANETPPVPDPATLVATTTGSTETVVEWDSVWHGTMPSAGYEIRLWQQSTDGWTHLGVESNADALYELTHPVFSRYAVALRSFNARPLYSLWSYEDSGVLSYATFETRPLLTGTYDVEKHSTGAPSGRYWKVTADLNATPPSFPTSGTTYSFYRVVGGVLQEPPVYSGPLNTYSDTVQVFGNPTSSNFPRTHYACVVTYTTTAYQVSTKTSQSNTVLTAPQNDEGTYIFAEGTW